MKDKSKDKMDGEQLIRSNQQGEHGQEIVTEDMMKYKITNYMESVEVPESLSEVIENTLLTERKRRKVRPFIKSFSGLAAGFLILVVSLNTSQSFAASMQNIPIIGSIVEVLTFRVYEVETENYHADIVAPQIEGLENSKLEATINNLYLSESESLYEQFEADMAELEANGGGHLGVDSGYEIKTDTDQLLSIGRYVVNTVGSSSTIMHYDTIDKENGLLLTLPSLFSSDAYIQVISDNIKRQMVDQMKNSEDQNGDPEKTYWVGEGEIEGFKTIAPDQNFYITDKGALVISFDKYEVAPGYMGICEFEIPSNVLVDLLVSDRYIH